MTQYLILFKPLEAFFFGGEVTFGDGITQNYLVKSNPFPQQTAILGTLRKELLIQKGYLRLKKNGYILDMSKKTEIENLIGPESFDISNGRQKFGVIMGLSPVFLTREGPSGRQFYVQAPMDLLEDGSRLALPEDPIFGRSNICWHKKEEIPLMQGYEAKTGIPDQFMDSTGGLLPLNKVFIPVERIGITKGKEGLTEENAFYKQTAYRLEKGFAFACIADIEEELKSELVFMGADRSAFMIEVEKFTQTFCEVFQNINPNPDERIVFLSDGLVAQETYELCRFAITQTVSFRNIRSSTGNYSFRKESRLHTFLKRGSVFFPKDKTRGQIKQDLGNLRLQAIGYNIFC